MILNEAITSASQAIQQQAQEVEEQAGMGATWACGWITGDRDAYTYLPASTEGFLPAERLAELLVEAGFREVGFHRVMLGTIAIHWGQKPLTDNQAQMS